MMQYTCPMHPEIVKDKPGICPECGMNLIKTQKPKGKTQKLEHDKHEGHSLEMFAKKFWVSLALTIPVVLYSELPQRIAGFIPPHFAGSQFLSLVAASIVFFYGGWVFIQGAARELAAKLPGMMTLIGLAITAAYSYSVFAVISGIGATLFWELTTLITVMLLGHYLEMRAVGAAHGALKELSKLLPDTAEIIIQNSKFQIQNHNSKLKIETKIIPLEELKLDDLVLVRPGGKIPADGVVFDGISEVNQSAITGESKPVAKKKGAQVIAGTVNGDGSLKVKVTKIGEATFLAGIMRLVAEAQASKSRLQILSDKAAFYLTVIAIVTGGITFIAWLAASSFVFAVERLVAVLVIACPHALGLAVPLVASISTTMAARNGFLVRNRLALEVARQIDIVLFDKTGTLTKGEYGVTNVWKMTAKDENEVLKLSASVDAASEHFISKAIVAAARERKIALTQVSDFGRIAGKGVQGIVGGKTVFVGGEAILENSKEKLPGSIQEEIEEENQKGKTIIYVVSDGQIAGVVACADLIREESRQAISELKKMGIKVAMITGDSEAVAAWVAKDLAIDEYFARVLPQEKAEKVKILQNRGLKVAMVGDGINDAPALTQADLGVAIGAGTNVAIESAGIILVRNDPQDLVKIIKLSKATFAKMIQNLFWATGYNIIALPAAAGALAFAGIILQPALSALLMSASTVIVAVNALLLRKTEKELATF